MNNKDTRSFCILIARNMVKEANKEIKDKI